jgi:hypothetical protein
MRLAGPRAADENDVALLRDEASAGEIAHQGFVDGCATKVEVVYVSLAMVIWYLMERACFSAISALRRSSTICGGSCCRLMAVAMTSS